MKRIYIAGCFLCLAFYLQAQTEEGKLQRELTVEKEYNPSLRDANKINELPDIKTPEAPKTSVDYSNYTLDCLIPPYFQPFKAKTYYSDFATSKKRGYLDINIGTLFNKNADAGYQILRSEKDRLSVFGSYRSSNSKVHSLQDDAKERMKISDNALGVDFWHRFKKAALSADAQYVYSGFNDYGFGLLTDSTPNDRVNQRFQTHLGLQSVNNERIHYQTNLSYTLFTQEYQPIDKKLSGTENRLMADGNLFTDFMGIAASVKTYFHPHNNMNYASLSAQPYLLFEGDEWNAHTGLTLSRQVGGVDEFLVSPDIRFNWRPSDAVLFYCSALGGIQDNSQYNSRIENRYISPLYRIRDSQSPFDGTVGIQFSPVANLSIDVFSGYQWLKDAHFYLLNDSAGTIPQYANAQKFKLGGLFAYHYRDIADFGLQWTYSHWNIEETAVKAWNQPAFAAVFNAGFQLPVIPFRTDLMYHLETGRINMKNIHAVDITGTYTLNEILSLYLKVNNVLNQHYELWYGYPAQACHILFGGSLKF
ncbi:MAG: hypothetical protein LBV57_04810 [Candidatus Symbiothrix sp.]|jgi:hypothetical protein|nr:hypothetical protein [Candidatus Symbiothrix sp.]